MVKTIIYIYTFTCLLVSGTGGAIAEDKLPTTLSKRLSEHGFSTSEVKLGEVSIHYIYKGLSENLGEENGENVEQVNLDKPLMIFLHGFPYFASAWLPILEPLSKDYSVVAPDNRGYAYSSKPEAVSDYHISKLVKDVKGLIDYLYSKGGCEPITLVGHDWGGVLAWSVAEQYSECVKQVIVINAPPYNTFLRTLVSSESQRDASRYIPWLSSWVSRFAFMIKGPDLLWGKSLEQLHQQGHVDDAFKAEFLTAWSQEGAAQGAASWYAANIPDFDDITTEHYLPNEKGWPNEKNWPNNKAKVTVPSLLIWSKHDKAFTQDTFNAIPQDVENLKVQLIDTTSHAPFIDHTEQVLGFMNEFLKQNDTVNRQ